MLALFIITFVKQGIVRCLSSDGGNSVGHEVRIIGFAVSLVRGSPAGEAKVGGTFVATKVLAMVFEHAVTGENGHLIAIRTGAPTHCARVSNHERMTLVVFKTRNEFGHHGFNDNFVDCTYTVYLRAGRDHCDFICLTEHSNNETTPTVEAERVTTLHGVHCFRL